MARDRRSPWSSRCCVGRRREPLASPRRRRLAPVAAAKRGHGAAPRARGPLSAARAARRSSKTNPARSGTRRRSSSRARAHTASGEFLYQGYLYDDHGAKEVTDPTNPMHSPGGDPSGGDLFSAPDGTYDYPTGPGYDENAANLIELRVKPLASATAFRITLNTLEKPELVATAIAIGGTRGREPSVPVRRQRERAGAVLPDRPRRNGGAHRRRHRRTEVAGPGAERERRPRAPPDHRRWCPTATGTRAARPCASPPASGSGTNATDSYLLPGAPARAPPSPAAPARTPPRPPSSTSPSASTPRSPCPGRPDPRNRGQPGLVARIGAGAGAGEQATSAPSTPKSTSPSCTRKSTTTCPASPTGVPQTGAFDRILASHFSDGQGADYATGGCGSSTRLHRRAARAAAALRDLRPERARARRRLGPDAAAALAVGQLQPVRGLAQPVAVRRPRRRLDRDHALRAAVPTAGTTTAPAPTRSRCGPTSPPTTGSTPPSPTSPATRWAATAPTSSPASSPTCSPRRSRPSGRPGLGIWVPPAEPQPGGNQSLTQRMLALGPQHPVPDLGRDDRRARADRGRARTGQRRSTRSATATSSTSSRPATT